VSVPLWGWAAVLAIILVMLAVDLLAHRKAHVVGVREALSWTLVWVALGISFGAFIWWQYGAELGAQYFAGYVIEKSLAVDNVFVFAIIFSYFAVPREYQHRVLFYGVLGALVFRAIFIAAGSVLIASFAWILYVFGALLVYTGYRMARTRNEHIDVANSRTVKLFKRFIPTTDDFVGQRFTVRRAGKLMATPLLMVLVLVEVTDIVFAIDSIPAIFAVTQEPFLVFTSNAFAILGLRAMYFLLADLIHRFVYLKLGLSIVLIWVGVKMLLLEVWKVPTLLSLGVVTAIIAVAVVASLRATRGLDAGDGHGTAESPSTPAGAVASPPPSAAAHPSAPTDRRAPAPSTPDALPESPVDTRATTTTAGGQS
jgi:tellurite resistance protein TerC